MSKVLKRLGISTPFLIRIAIILSIGVASLKIFLDNHIEAAYFGAGFVACLCLQEVFWLCINFQDKKEDKTHEALREKEKEPIQ